MMLCDYRPNKIWSITDVVAPDFTEPVTLDEAKRQCIVDFDDDNNYITALITQCRDGLEQFCNISMVSKNITLYADLYEETEIPYGPVTSITSVAYRNGTTYDAITDYITDGDAGSFMRFAPTIGARYKMVYVAGPYAPASLKLDLLRIIAYCYEHRGDEALTSLQNGVGRPKSLDEAMELFAAKYRRWAWL